MNQNQPKFNYGEALQKSNLFYLAQRSGDLPDDYVISWRDDSAVNDGADVNHDLSGGYYDAGDHVKFGFPMAASMTMLSWGLIEYSDGYKKVGQFDNTLDNIRWGTDYILKAYDDKGTATTSDDVFWGQVGDGQKDHGYWGAPEDMNMSRPAFKVDAQNPGSDLTAESAAALASASIAFRSSDEAYADKLLEKAKGLYEFAEQHRGAYSDSISNVRNFYNSWSGYQDELAWGAIWLHKASLAKGETDRQYLDKAQELYTGLNPAWTHNWDDKSYGTAILLAQETGSSKYKQDVEAWLDNWADPNGGIQKTAGGLAWLDQWGSLRYTANTAFLAGVYGDTVKDKQGKYTGFSESQINYILGDNPNNFSYMVGFGENYPQNPHHRAASGTTNIGDSDSNQYTLYGALVGGPSAPNDNAYQDKRTDYIANEVALDYNAAFTGALARMTEQFGGEALTEIPGINLDETINLNDSGGNDNPEVDNPDGDAGTLKDFQFSVENQWSNGFIGKIKITNNNNQAINGWELEFTAPFEIKNIWSASIESDEGNEYVIKNLGYNHLIASGESVEFGFQGSYSGDINLALDNAELKVAENLSSATTPTDSNPVDLVTGSVDNSDIGNDSIDPITNGGDPNTANEATDNIVFSLVNQWNNGFTANVKITNNSNEVVNGWELELNTPFEIKEIWNSRIESHEGNEYFIENVGWNASIAPGSSLEFGFNGVNPNGISEQDIINQVSFYSDSFSISDS
ncbi:putative endoglucanase [Calothrix parasitica NIES-267]|uniref:Endoglucanase n=1 Tax=Calothrix parasitica NIES-267 TaxID=1973488 RepID=A0A1Z4LMG0_9CYAN|nr:putative endoglucanase [Calothrix parasitica NIES-267]